MIEHEGCEHKRSLQISQKKKRDERKNGEMPSEVGFLTEEADGKKN